MTGGTERRQRWWQRTYAVPRWIVWVVVANTLLRLPSTIHIVGWFK